MWQAWHDFAFGPGLKSVWNSLFSHSRYVACSIEWPTDGLSITGRLIVWQLPHRREFLMYSWYFGVISSDAFIGCTEISLSSNGPKISPALPAVNWPVIW